MVDAGTSGRGVVGVSVAAGWYPDPWAPDTPVVRWWDGTQW
ncbi:MAG: DUF2510 domain-containing protein, partial [Acidimicrobiales bacterium]|nr:DUF2510 domain-containing protein [Acidimicrobiales bacterium]